MFEALQKELTANGLVTAFLVVGIVMWLSVQLSRLLTRGRVQLVDLGRAQRIDTPRHALSPGRNSETALREA